MWINLNIFERHYKILHKCKLFDLAREGARYKYILNYRENFFSATYPWYLLNYSLVATLDTTFDNSNFYTNNNLTSPTNNTSSIYSDTFTGYESNRTFILCSSTATFSLRSSSGYTCSYSRRGNKKQEQEATVPIANK